MLNFNFLLVKIKFWLNIICITEGIDVSSNLRNLSLLLLYISQVTPKNTITWQVNDSYFFDAAMLYLMSLYI